MLERTRLMAISLFAALLCFTTAGAGEVLQLAPSNIDLKSKDLKPGLAVGYAYYEVRNLHEAEGYRSHVKAKDRKTIKGFMYGDTELGQKILTAEADQFVIAFISGYMRLQEGVHQLEFQSNDGVRVHLGGVEVYEHDGRHTCSTQGPVTVKAPKTAWYPVKTLFFQRLNTACLDLSIRSAGGDWDWTKEEIYAHVPN